MTRFAVIWDKNTDSEYEKEVLLSDGLEWTDCILNDLENANWHTARHALEPLLYLLPEIYKVLDPRMQKRLQNAVDFWDTEF